MSTSVCAHTWLFNLYEASGSRCDCCVSLLYIKSVPLGSDGVDPRGTVGRTRGVRLKNIKECAKVVMWGRAFGKFFAAYCSFIRLFY